MFFAMAVICVLFLGAAGVEGVEEFELGKEAVGAAVNDA